MIPDFFAPGIAAAFVLTALRVAGLMLIAPAWSAKTVPMKLRTAMIVTFALILLPAATANASLRTLAITPATFLAETVVGFMIGLAAALTIAAAEFSGELITLSIGLSGAAIFDPLNGAQNPVFAQFMQLLAVAILVIGGGHVLMLEAVGASFGAMPLGAPIDIGHGLAAFAPAARTIFVTGLQFASPVVAAVLVTNIALAVLGRAAPALNIMTLAFPLQICIGLITFAGSIALVVHGIAQWTPSFTGSLELFVRGSRLAAVTH